MFSHVVLNHLITPVRARKLCLPPPSFAPVSPFLLLYTLPVLPPPSSLSEDLAPLAWIRIGTKTIC